jgi:hypothetical protein
MNNLTPIIDEEVLLTFPDAIHELTNGAKIARLAWKPADSYGLLKDGFLMIWIDGQFKKWLVNDGDLTGTDWIVLSDLN